jgi:hypothetical protein
MAVRRLAIYPFIPGTGPALAGIHRRGFWSHCEKIVAANAHAVINDKGIGKNMIGTVVPGTDGQWHQ